MKVKVNIREYLEAATDHNGDLQLTARFEPDDLFEASGIPDETEIDVDIDELLAENRQIAHIWGIDEVRQLRPDLDDGQAWDVLLSVRDDLDAKRAITFLIWNTIARTADELYPGKEERVWQGCIDVRIADTESQDEVLTRLRGMADLIAKDTPGVEAEIDPGSVRLLASDKTTTE